MIQVITNHSIAKNSLDHQHPCGVINDNNTSTELLSELMCQFNRTINILDIGCAGGQFIIDAYNLGNVAVGVEGSDHAKNNSSARGHHNWEKYYNTLLFNVDATKHFQITKNNETLNFDVITSWEVIEHIEEKDLNPFFDNIYNLLTEKGFFIGSIATGSSGTPIELHRTIKNKEWWINFLQDKFLIEEYPFRGAVRGPRVDNFLIKLNKKV